MQKKLSKSAYGGVSGEKYVPYVNQGDKKVGNVAILIMGSILAIIFAASTAYSGMKAGLTVAAGIPGSIIGSGLVGAFAKSKGILGKNIMQGMSSGGESIASGMIYVLPAIILIGGHINFIQGVIVGVLAILFSIGTASLVHNYLIVEEHGKLVYPEAMAISEALVASDTGGDSLKYMGVGFGIGGIITMLTSSVFGVVNNMISYVGSSFYKWKLDVEVNPLLAGIGFIVGLEVSLTMFAGAILSNFAIAPLIGYFTDMAGNGAHVWNNTSLAVNQMAVNDLSSSYVKYIGAGMMLCGGLIGAIKLIPTIVTSIKKTLAAKNVAGEEKNTLGMVAIVAGGVGIFVVGVIIAQNFLMGIVGALLAAILSLLFVIVSARIAGTIGCSNLPVSGMTIASLVIMTVVFVLFGWTDNNHTQILLMFGTFVVTAIAVGGGYMQSQKVTYVIGGSKSEMMKYFMIAGIVGVIVTVGTITILSPQFVTDSATPAFGLPQANLIATLTSGIMTGKLPWIMIIVGVVMALAFYFLDLPIMTVAIGFYLPISTTSIILIGALIKVFIEKVTRDEAIKNNRVQSGISLSSGLIAGGSIIGLIGIILHVTGVLKDHVLTGFANTNAMGIILLAVMVVSITVPLMMIHKGGATEDGTSESGD
ncbi:OPT/YSL family transporter [Latilactobacillus fragifolii]|uniref:OPT/YSL family transporter n=1 Tax=Latilactobacillus fragifolii TaxID=2814244 RepID=UPI001ABB2EE6|nr:OPT family oligopeptide transporter [Latilactobacillus fragifolii]